MINNNGIKVHPPESASILSDSTPVNCAHCSLRELCVPGGISACELRSLDQLASTKRRVSRGEYLFRIGDGFNSLFAIRAGFFKIHSAGCDGRGQITGFQLPGELLGLEGMANDRHCVDAIALQDSEVCVLPYADLEQIASQFQPLQRQLSRIMSREIVRERDTMLVLGSMRADERVSAFLLNLSERYKQLGYSSTNFILLMTREEIGSFLGLKLETVSRAFSRLSEQQLIGVRGRHIQLMDMTRLRGLVNQ